MSHESERNWVDVVSLSQKNCPEPIVGQLKYATNENLVGRPISGYHSDALDVCLMTKKAAQALIQVQNDLVKNYSYGLAIYDSYRPLRAVQDFAQWMQKPPAGAYELARKKIHYPDIPKSKLSELGYLSSTVSRHCFGGTVDLVLIKTEDKKELEMGSVFDFLGERSHTTMTQLEIGEEAFSNRRILKEVMSHYGFVSYFKEYWHFEYHEAELDSPCDFEILASLRGIY